MNRIVGVLVFSGLVCGLCCGAADQNPPKTEKLPEPIKIGKIVFEGGDGSSMEKAVIIKNAKNEEEGVESEVLWMKKVHPGWRKGNQALLIKKGKSYDRIEYSSPDGKTMTVFFDITEFFGKY